VYQADARQVSKGKLHVLDYSRITDALRESSRKLLTDPLTDLPNALAQQLSIPTTSSIPGSTLASSKPITTTTMKGGKGRLMTPDEKRRVVEALTRAQTAEEVRKLERMLADGLIPEGEVVGGEDEAMTNGNGVTAGA
jgi:U2 small nuclear ribonucleoprotein A'